MPSPLALEQAKQQLETDLKAAIARHADGKPHELDLSFGERGTPGVGALSDLHDGVELEVYRLIDSFHEDPVVEDSRMRVGHITAIDSDGDGTASLSVRYVYLDEDIDATLASGSDDALDDLTTDELALAAAAENVADMGLGEEDADEDDDTRGERLV